MIRSTQLPLRFDPFLRPMVWGGRRFTRYLGKNLPTRQAYGESWEVSDHPLHHSRLAIASLFGVSLRQLMEHHREDLLGPAVVRFPVFPWLIKLLDANDWLSVQVHPDEAAAKRLCPGESAKTEAWYILDAAPQSRIYAGLKAGVDQGAFRKALSTGEQGAITDCMHSFTPTPGDVVYLPAGTVHALGGGVLLAEIQQTSDATFRLFDWNRNRPLHIEESLASIHWDQGPIEPIRAHRGQIDHRERLVGCPYFEMDHLRCSGAFELGGVGRLQALVVADGQGRFDNGEYFMAGDAWLLPALMPAMTLHPDKPLTGILCSLLE